ncbi:MAG TPA: GNAT family N-acetyltransferase [Trebonia sp.]|nr:GNAT family N-acetyltransferase [Trebonia sp.]
MPHPLDNPALFALQGPQASLGQRKGRAWRYHPDVCPFYGMPDDPGAADWADAAALAGPGSRLTLAATWTAFPAGWEVVFAAEGVQMVAGDALGARPPDPAGGVTELGAGDYPEMAALVERTRPGPFCPRTPEMGAYFGIRREGALVAMAGERLRPPGLTEISAVCTDDAWRGHGLASILTHAVAARIRSRGEVPFLHALAANTTAIGLYEHLGFTRRRTVMFRSAIVPAALP